MAGSRSSRRLPSFEPVLVLLLLAAAGTAALWWFHRQGRILYYGDALAHLNIARRILDSRTPGYEQIGTVWLPLPHALMLPRVGDDAWWRSGLAGAVPSAACFVLAGVFLFLAARRLLGSRAAAWVATAAFALNPNLLYLSSTPMTEPVFFACLAALFYLTVRFAQSASWWLAAPAGLIACAATLVRYEGWFLVPFFALAFLLSGRKRRWLAVSVFAGLAVLGPLYWLAHNWWFYGDALEFYRGQWSAKAIYEQALAVGMQRYAGDGDWRLAARYFSAAARLCAGWPLVLLGFVGAAFCLFRPSRWPVVLLALPPAFYIWSIHSSGTPVFVPHLWPNSYYNTRYGLAALPLLALGAGALAAAAPDRFRPWSALALVALSISPWLLAPRPAEWICWKESEVNSAARRAWTAQAASFFKERYRGGGILIPFGDLAGIFHQAGIPLRETVHEGNHPQWEGIIARPDLFLKEEWAVAIAGDTVATTVQKAQRLGGRYGCVRMIAVKGAPVIEIYKRDP